jgi:valyl-tRNA synthetase
MSTAEQTIKPVKPTASADLWIMSRLDQAITEVSVQIDAYRMDLAAQRLYEFIWNEYCGWYLELSKPALQKGNSEEQNATRYTLLTVLERSLRILHPFMPFITEEIAQH